MDAGEFARLFAVEGPRVLRVLRRLGVREADMEDVCQEVFIVVHRRAGEFRGASSVRTWIYGIALRCALGYRRRKHVRDGVVLVEEPAVPPEQPDELERVRARRVLQAALDKLAEGPRVVFVLYELEQLSMREVAHTLEVPLATAYSRLHAARAALRDEFARLQRSGAWP